MVKLPFRDRAEAGRLLGAELARRNLRSNSIVLALIRGGVPIGVEVAEALKCPLDIVVVRKIGVPWQPELAMGAIAGQTRVLDHQLIGELRVSAPDIENEIAKETKEMHRREKLYRDDLPSPDVASRRVILVDDGLATGSTMIAAVKHLRTMHPRRVIVTVPVASHEACARLSTEADECVSLAEPKLFCAVGEWYSEFPQLTDAEVCALMRLARTC